MIMNTKFIKIFDNEVEAEQFANAHHTKAIIRYDWDDFYMRIIEQFVVKY